MNTRLTFLLLLLPASLARGVVPLGEAPRCLAEAGRVAQPAAPRFLRQWGSNGSEPGEFHFPIGIAINAVDEVFVTDFYNERVQKFTVYDRSGKFLKEWGESGPGNGEFNYPGGLAAGRDGRLYVADQTNRRVQVFDTAGKFLTKWGEYGVKPGQFGGNVIPKSRGGGPNGAI